MTYEYECKNCGYGFEMFQVHSDDRDAPTKLKCAKCGERAIVRLISQVSIDVPEGAYGNAANGYSSTHGDAENFKAIGKGPKPYDKRKMPK